jgi:hypothetical protein
MMKSAEDRPRGDVIDSSNRTNKRRVLGQRQMRPDTVVVGGIGVEDLTQVGLAKDHDVIQAFSPDRAGVVRCIHSAKVSEPQLVSRGYVRLGLQSGREGVGVPVLVSLNWANSG